jgi:hypothetical protein
MGRTLVLCVLGCCLLCAGGAWLAFRVVGTPPPVPHEGAPPLAAPVAGQPPAPAPGPTINVKQRVSRPWLDTLEVEYKGGYLDAWIDMEIYGVRDELSLTMPQLLKLHRHEPNTPGSWDAGGHIEVVILHRLGSHRGRAAPELLIDAESSVWRGTEEWTVGHAARHFLPVSARLSQSRGQGNSPFNPTDWSEYDPGATTFVAFKVFTSGHSGLGWPESRNYWDSQTGSADPRFWKDRERRLGPPAAGAAAAMIGLGGPLSPALTAAPVVPTYQELYLAGSLVQVKYRFLTPREVALVRALGEKAEEKEVTAVIKGFRRMPNRVGARAEKE